MSSPFSRLVICLVILTGLSGAGSRLHAQECLNPELPSYLGAADGAYTVAASPVGTDLVAAVTVDSALAIYRVPADAAPELLVHVPLGDDFLDVAAVGDHLYVAGDSGVRIFAVGEDGIPVDGGLLTGQEGAVDLAVDGQLLAVVHAAAWSLWDCGDPALPVRHVRVPDATGVTLVAVGGDRLVTGMYEGPNQVFDIGDPAAPALVGTYSDPPYTNDGDGIHHPDGRFLNALEIVRGRTYELRHATFSGGSWIYGDRWYRRYYELVVRDLADPTAVTQVAGYNLGTDTSIPLVGVKSALARSGDLLAAGQQAKGVTYVVDASRPLTDEPRVLPATNGAALAWQGQRLAGLGFGAGLGSGAWSWDIPEDMAPGTVVVSGAGTGGLGLRYTLMDLATDTGLVATSMLFHTSDEHWEDMVYRVQLYQPAVSTTVAVEVASYYWDPTSVALLDDLLVATNSSTTVFDISDPSAPGPGVEIPSLADARQVVGLWHRLLAVGTASGELQIVDLADPQAPVVLGSCTLSDEPYLIRARGSELLIAAGDRLEVVHVIDPAAPTVEASIVCAGPVRDVVGYRGRGLAVVTLDNHAYQMAFDYPTVPIGIPDGIIPKAEGEPELTRLSTNPNGVTFSGAHYFMAGQGMHAVKLDAVTSAGSAATLHPILGAVDFDRRLYAVCADMLVDMDDVFCSLPSATGEVLPGLPMLALTAAPNPFNPLTRVSFTLSGTRPVQLQVFDLRGRRMRELADGLWPEGRHVVPWNGRDDMGRELASGIYFVRLQAGAESAVMKVTLVR